MNEMDEKKEEISEVMDTDYDENKSKYLVFKIGDGTYGTQLLGVREVVRKQEIRPVPNTKNDFLGVVNVRGEIIGVTDIRLCFNEEANTGPFNALILFESPVGALAGLVDEVESVIVIPEKNIDRSPNISTRVPGGQLLGVGKVGDRLIHLIDLNRILGKEELLNIRKVIS